MLTGTQFAIEVTGPTFTGGISNAGTLTATAAGGDGIDVFQTSTFTGGVTNTGTITIGPNGAGIAIINVPTFMGGVSNSGTITGGAEAIEVFGFGGATTFSGGITNTGTLHANVGIVAFGITQFSGGISNGGTITGVGGVAVDDAIFSGGISNSGTIAVSGNGIRVALSVGSMTMTSFSGGIVNTGTIVAGNQAISISAISTFDGNISNAGTLSAASGIVVGAGVNFAGGAIVNSGDITGTTAAIDVSGASNAITIDQTAGTITGAIKLSSHTDFLNISGGVINGNVVGQGNGFVNFDLGAGTFTYASPFAMTALGFANFNSGAVFVDGSIGATFIDVNNGGTAAGTGTLAGAVNVLSGGTLMPGQPLGTLNVNGSLTFNAGSTYAVHITPSANSATSITGAPGSATINGGTVTVTPQLGHYNANQYVIVTTTGGRSGTFSGLNVNGSLTGSMTLDYSNPNDVLLDVGAGFALFSTPLGANQNQQNVLNGINNAILAGDNLPSGFAGLSNLTNAGLLNALTELSGQNGAGFSQGAFQAGNSFLGLMVNPFVEGRFGDGFGPVIGFAPGEPPALRQAAAAFASAMPVKAPPPTFDQRFSAWGAAYGGSGTIDGNATVGAQRTTASDAAFAAGIDYLLSPNTTVGFALAGGGTSWSLDGGLGNGRSDMFQAGVYARQRFGDAYLAGALAYNFHDVTTNRTVTVAGTDMLQGRFQANGLGARLEGGYHVATPFVRLTPYGAVQVQSIFIPGYGETATAGSNQFALNYAAQTATTTRTEVGSWFDKTWFDRSFLDRGHLWTVYGRLAWAHDFGDTPQASAIFQALPGSNFIVNGAAPAADRALVTAGARYDLMNGWSFTAKLDGELSSNATIFSGTGVARKTW